MGSGVHFDKNAFLIDDPSELVTKCTALLVWLPKMSSLMINCLVPIDFDVFRYIPLILPLILSVGLHRKTHDKETTYR